jgi:DNA replication initiation complex subunit (GINS family)
MPDHYTQLLEWRRNEAAVRGLSKLPHDFYRATSAYLAEVRRSYEGDLRENPSGRKGEISRQTYQRASQIARDIVEARTQKVLTAAFQASIGGTRELTNALAEERTMFDTVLSSLSEHRRLAAPYLEAMAIPTTATAVPPAPKAAEPAALPPTAEPPTAVAAPRNARPVPPLTYVRVLKSGRPLSVGSETVDLREDDVLSLPADAAKLLIDAKVAEPVATGPERPVT